MNYAVAYLLLAGAVAASGVASFLVAFEVDAVRWTAVLAALPGFLALAGATFRYAERADWWNEKGQLMDQLRRDLVYEGGTNAEVSAELSKQLAELRKKWPSFGQAPG